MCGGVVERIRLAWLLLLLLLLLLLITKGIGDGIVGGDGPGGVNIRSGNGDGARGC